MLVVTVCFEEMLDVFVYLIRSCSCAGSWQIAVSASNASVVIQSLCL
jgi:hypothetical protein